MDKKDEIPTSGIVGEINRIRTELGRLSVRLSMLEEIVKSGKEIAPKDQISLEPKTKSLEPSGNSNQPFEFTFGRLWLNRIGIILFVLGIGLLISYSLHYFSSVMKVISGYALGFGLLVWAGRLEVHEQWKKWSWGILGGGWGIIYLTTFALHYIPVTRLIENTTMAVLALAAVNATMIVYNLKYKSPEVTGLTYVLGFMTLGLGGYDVSTVILWAMLILSLVSIAVSFRWASFLTLGLVSSYSIFVIWHFPFMGESSHRVWILVISWLVFSAGLLNLSKDISLLRDIVRGYLLNTTLFFLAMLLMNFGSDHQMSMWVLLASGAHLMLAAASRWLNAPRLIVINCLISFALSALYIWMKGNGWDIAVLWLAQVAVLSGLGIYYKEMLYRACAFVGALLVVLRLAWTCFGLSSWVVWPEVGSAILFLALGTYYASKEMEPTLEINERRLYPVFYSWASSVIVFVLIGHFCPERWLTFAWMVQALGFIGLGFLLNHRSLRLAALTLLFLDLCRVFFVELAGVQTIYKIIAVTTLGFIFVGVSFFYARLKKN